MYIHRLGSSDPIGDYVKGANGRVVIVTSRYSAFPAKTILVAQRKHVLRVPLGCLALYRVTRTLENRGEVEAT